MKNLIQEILTNQSSRSNKSLTAFIATTFNAGQPWG